MIFFSRLRIFTVHIDPAAAHPYETARFVEEGFSWKAFLFTGFWALYNRLWWQAGVLFCSGGLLLQMYCGHVLTHTGMTILWTGIAVYTGFQAGEWQREKLRRRGFVIADLVSGDSLVRGQQRFFDRYFATHPTEQHIV